MKFMNTKRFASTVMAGVLTLSLAVPAFAASTQDPNSTVIDGSYTEVPISVVVPESGTAQINPYGLPVTVTKSDDKTVSLVGQQITTAPLSIKNQGTVGLDVNATLAVVPKGDVVIKGAALTDGTDKGKEIDVNLEVVGLDDATLAVSSESEKLDDLLIDMFANEDNWDGAETLRAPAAAKGATTVATPAKSGSPMAVLGAVTAKSEGFNYGANSIAMFRLAGELNEVPQKTVSGNDVDDPWAAADGFTATVVSSFKPHVFVEASARLDNTTLSATAGGTAPTLTVTFNAGDTGLTVKSYAWSSDTPGTAVATGTTATPTITLVAAGTTNIKCTLTLSDDSTIESDVCVLTVAAAPGP